jgi:hypothetical protein
VHGLLRIVTFLNRITGATHVKRRNFLQNTWLIHGGEGSPNSNWSVVRRWMDRLFTVNLRSTNIMTAIGLYLENRTPF